MNLKGVNIKGTKNGLEIHLDTSLEPGELKKTLQMHLEAAKGFFKGAYFSFKPSDEGLSDQQMAELSTICKKYGLIPHITHEKEKRPRQKNRELQTQGLSDSEINMQNQLIETNVRNGQQLYFNGNVILLGDVNPGGQITATGSIIIIGALLGIAHGGANGDREAFIFACDFRPHQVRIADTIARSPSAKSLPTSIPEIARLEKDSIIIEQYKIKK